MKIKKIVITFLLLLCFDLLLWRFIFNEEFTARRFSDAVGTSLFVSLFWLIPIKTKKELDGLFFKQSGMVLLPSEKLILGSIANQINGAETIGGKLFLTNKRVVFISNKANVQNRHLEFERAQIVSVQPHPEFPKAIVFITNHNAIDAFNVDLHDRWVKELVR
jgi:hypothetical protein